MQRRQVSSVMAALAVFATLASVPQSAHAQDKSVVQNRTGAFYRWYVGQIKRGRSPLSDRAMMRRYTSRRLAKWIYSPAYREYDADYFIDAQDFDRDWDSVRTTDFKQRGAVATLTALLGKPHARGNGMGTQKLQLKWLRENGAWKLDRVNNR